MGEDRGDLWHHFKSASGRISCPARVVVTARVGAMISLPGRVAQRGEHVGIYHLQLSIVAAATLFGFLCGLEAFA